MSKITYQSKWPLGKTVYLKTDREQLPRIITRVTFYEGGLLYALVQGTSESVHYEFEIDDERNALMELGIDE